MTLADRVGAIVDHMHADALLRDLDVMRSSGVLLTTPNEAHVRADTLLLIGPGLDGTWPELPRRLFGQCGQSRSGDAIVARRIYCLCPGSDLAIPASAQNGGRGSLEDSAATVTGSPCRFARARRRQAHRRTHVSSSKLDEIATGLKAARFGVAVWSAAALDAPAIEMLCGLVDDLNAATRFSGLPLAPADNAIGVMQTCAWMTGLPMRTDLRADPRTMILGFLTASASGRQRRSGLCGLDIRLPCERASGMAQGATRRSR